MALHSFALVANDQASRAGNGLANFDVTGEMLPNETGFEGIIGRSRARRTWRFDCAAAGRDRHRQGTHRPSDP
jgi:hypothetical protein